ncbi:hypothetical protein OK016_06275 [Vibrio chagasii]|nr:hypothetical protein [Vibrio chagasii]
MVNTGTSIIEPLANCR